MTSYKKAYFDLIAENDRVIVKLNKIKEIAQWHTTNADSEDVQNDMNDILQIIESEE